MDKGCSGASGSKGLRLRGAAGLETHPWPFGITSHCPRGVPSPVSPPSAPSRIQLCPPQNQPRGRATTAATAARTLVGTRHGAGTKPTTPLRRTKEGRRSHAGAHEVWQDGDGGVPRTPTSQTPTGQQGPGEGTLGTLRAKNPVLGVQIPPCPSGPFLPSHPAQHPPRCPAGSPSRATARVAGTGGGGNAARGGGNPPVRG